MPGPEVKQILCEETHDFGGPVAVHELQGECCRLWQDELNRAVLAKYYLPNEYPGI